MTCCSCVIRCDMAAFGLKTKMPEGMAEIVLDNYDPMLPNEERSYIVIDG